MEHYLKARLGLSSIVYRRGRDDRIGIHSSPCNLPRLIRHALHVLIQRDLPPD